MAKCLVTGHKGYIGSKLFDVLKSMGHDVLGIDLLDEHPRDIIKVLRQDNEGQFHPHYFNFQPEYIFHLACWPRIGQCLEEPVMTMENNVLAGSTLLNYAAKVGSVKRVIYSSSSAVLGEGSGPTNPYALHKYVTELESKIYAEIYGIDTVSLRYFNVYSEDQSADGPYATVVANWMKCIREDITPFISGDGEQRRDMVHVEDVVLANIFAMNCDVNFKGEHYDIGTGRNISLNEIRQIVSSYHDIEFDFVPPRAGEVMSTTANIDKLAKLGWQARISIENGINKCFNFKRPM